jgi:hypothetical protein
MRQAVEQAKIYENSLMLINKTIKKNQLTIKQLETVPAERSVYVPLGRAYSPIFILDFSKERKKIQLNKSTKPAKNWNKIRKT